MSPPHLAWALDDEARTESCLVLNVFTPSLDPTARLPVLVYLHGGGFTYGSASAPALEGTSLASLGAVVVTLNHRLNVFGLLFLGERDDELADSGNVGLLDIVEALRWVRDGIAAFGGDPDRVTVFGQSGGGSKVGALMAMPMACGLFHRAIIQSASSVLRFATLEEAERNTHHLLHELGAGPGDLTTLFEAPPARLLSAMDKAIEEAGYVDDYRPVVDGRVLPSQPFSPDRPESMAPEIPLIIGWCENEQRLAFSRDPRRFHAPEVAVRAELARDLDASDDEVAAALDVYRRTRPTDSPGDLHAQIYGDFTYRTTATHAAEARVTARCAPTFMYQLTWRTPVLDGLLRSPHTLCLPFVFRTAELAQGITGGGADRHRLEEEMSRAWLSFAEGGKPAPASAAEWAPYDVADRTTLVFGAETRGIVDLAWEERLALAGLRPYRPAIGEGARRRPTR